MAQTSISWTATVLPDGTILPGYTFNPWIGCTKVSDGCKFCYAEEQNSRWHWNPAGWGDHAPRHITSGANWDKIITWNNAAKRSGIRRKVFVGSLMDVCDDHESILPAWRDNLAYIVRQYTWLDFLFLTKHPENFMRLYSQYFPNMLPANLWIGATIENMKCVERAADLCEIPATVRFISCEPLLESLHIRRWLGYNPTMVPQTGIDYVICGGESGRNARPMKIAWMQELYEQCQDAGIPFFAKQDYGVRPGQQGRIPDHLWCVKQFPQPRQE